MSQLGLVHTRKTCPEKLVTQGVGVIFNTIPPLAYLNWHTCIRITTSIVTTMHFISTFHFWFPYLHKLSAYINLCIDIFMWFPSGKGWCSHTTHINPYYNSCLTLLADFNQSSKSSTDLRHNYFPTVFIKTDKPSTGKTSCYCWHGGTACSSAFITLSLHRTGPL